jgi:nicotinate phosphoribosyltransferase
MDPSDPGILLTDLYQLTMLQGYYARGMHQTAVFELFVRRLPEHRQFLLAAGLEQVMAFLEGARFEPEDIDWLAGTGRFRPRFLEWLSGWRFTGELHALPEGTVFFANEPILRITAPLPEAQLVETRIINLIHLQVLLASKAARSVLSAPGRALVEFGLRRAHGAEAGLAAARASYLAGFAGTSNVLAGRLWGIPLYGTMAHSFIQAHDQELEAFEAYARACPEGITLLIDTYDTESAAVGLVPLARNLAAEGISIRAVRIDSGDLGQHARRVRRILDEGGLAEVEIFASGDLDENALHELIAGGAPIDGFGVGTRLSTVADRPYLDCAYKLVEYAGRPRRKRSEGKVSLPGRKQVFRRYDAAGRMEGDTVGLCDEADLGMPLLVPVMAGGRRIGQPPALAAIRERAAAELASLPGLLCALEPAAPYEVRISVGLRALAARP